MAASTMSRHEQFSAMSSCNGMPFPPLPSMFSHPASGTYCPEQSVQDFGYQQNQMYAYSGYTQPNYLAPSPYTQPPPIFPPLATLPSQTSLSLPPFQYSRPEYQHSAASSATTTPIVPTLASSVEHSQHVDHLLPPSSDTSRRRQSSQGSSASESGSEVSAKSGSQPGPIPANKQIDSYYDQANVRHVWFEYSRNSIRHDYDIRCDVDTINVENLSREFKMKNCVYPRAMLKDYSGNRLKYETECNRVGWQLAELNPVLQGKRGLIQRAVDTWRNSHTDTSLLSRRAKRQTQKQTRRAKAQAGMRPSQRLMLQMPPVPQSSIHTYSSYEAIDDIPTTQSPFGYITPLMVSGPSTMDGIQYSL